MTRLPINMTRRASRAMLASPYKLHAAVAGSVPAFSKGEAEGRVLWRVDRSDNGAANLLIVSPVAPSLVGLDEQIGWPDLDPQWQTRDYRPLLDRLREGQRYAFRLVANPVVNRPDEKNSGGPTKRVGHLTILQQTAWLAGTEAYKVLGVDAPQAFTSQDESRAMRNGFRVIADSETRSLQLVVSDSVKESFVNNKGRRITIAKARYDGLLEITDVRRMRNALCFGIGHAKSFGCGLITLASADMR